MIANKIYMAKILRDIKAKKEKKKNTLTFSYKDLIDMTKWKRRNI